MLCLAHTVSSYIVAAGVLFAYSCCKPLNKSGTSLEKLPAATQQGTNTFGCLINGEVFVIHKSWGDLSPYYSCVYQVQPNFSHLFGVGGSDKKSGCYFKSVTIQLDSITLQEAVYSLNTPVEQNGHFGIVNVSAGCESALKTYQTNTVTGGELTVTHLDPLLNIVSGTFWFTAVDAAKDDTLHVTDGRFDMHYIQ